MPARYINYKAKPEADLKPAKRRPPPDINFYDGNGVHVMRITDLSITIMNPQEAALALVKDVMTAPRGSPAVRYNNLITISILDGFRLNLEPRAHKPNNWDEFVEQYDRIIKQKAFV